MSHEHYIETDKGRLYIHGDDAVEMIVPPGYKPENEPVPAENLPKLPSIIANVSDEEAEAIAEKIAQNLRMGVTK